MEYTKLGKSDLTVSRICMGCMGFGDPAQGQHRWTVDAAGTQDIIKHGLDTGINFFDTAIGYQNGTSEQYVGRALRALTDRSNYVIATKFLPRTKDEIVSGVSGQQHIKDNLEKSLQNLGMDYVDLYIYHMWDYNTPMEEIMDGLNQVVKEGKVRYIGISNCFTWQLAKANFYARQHGLTEFVSSQVHYNLMAREEEREMLPFCHDQQIAVTPYSSLASGRLSRTPGETSKRMVEDAYAHFKYDRTEQADNRVILRVAEVAEKRGASMTEVSLAWLLNYVAAPIVGATKFSHVDGAVKAFDLKLSQEEINYMEELYVPHALVGVMAENVPKRTTFASKSGN